MTANRASRYLRTFFDEKQLPIESWTVEAPGGTPNHFDTEIVIERIFAAPESEQQAIGDTIRRIDFGNGDVNRFLRHLSKALAFDL